MFGTTFMAGSIAVARIGEDRWSDSLAHPNGRAHPLALAGNVALTLWPGPPCVLAPDLRRPGLRRDLRCPRRRAVSAAYWKHALFAASPVGLHAAWAAAAVFLPIAAGRLFDLLWLLVAVFPPATATTAQRSRRSSRGRRNSWPRSPQQPARRPGRT